MWRYAILLSAVGLLLLAPTVSQAQFKQGDWELTLGGTGANGPDLDGFTFGINGDVGYFFTDQLELSLRQAIVYTDIGVSGASWDGSTRIALDFPFDLGRWQPFVGGNFGYVYGDNVNDTWEAAPEAGVKYFLNSTTFVFALAEYQFFFDNSDSVQDSFSDGQFV